MACTLLQLQGYISRIKKVGEQGQEFMEMVEFNPYAFVQNTDFDILTFDSFADAVDEYFSKMESQKLELSILEKVCDIDHYMYFNYTF